MNCCKGIDGADAADPAELEIPAVTVPESTLFSELTGVEEKTSFAERASWGAAGMAGTGTAMLIVQGVEEVEELEGGGEEDGDACVIEVEEEEEEDEDEDEEEGRAVGGINVNDGVNDGVEESKVTEEGGRVSLFDRVTDIRRSGTDVIVVTDGAVTDVVVTDDIVTLSTSLGFPSNAVADAPAAATDDVTCVASSIVGDASNIVNEGVDVLGGCSDTFRGLAVVADAVTDLSTSIIVSVTVSVTECIVTP